MILDPKILDRVVGIGSLLEPELHEKLAEFLRQDQDIFSLCHEDIPRNDPQVTLTDLMLT